MSFAFPASARLGSPREFEAVLKGGRRVSERWLTAATRDTGAGRARLGLAISARAVPRAVDRNRIKRQTRETFRAQRHALPAVDIVMLARQGAGGAPGAELRETLQRLWRRLGAGAPA